MEKHKVVRELNPAEKIARELMEHAMKIGAGSVVIAVSVPSKVAGDPWWGYTHGQALGADAVQPGILGVMALKDMGAFGPQIAVTRS